jgi:hypothetical protein
MGMLGVTEIMLIVLVVFGICLLPTIFYLLTLMNTLNLVSVKNRKMEPGMVWLILIPLFGIVWQFIVVNNIADSLRDEFKERNINVGEERPGSSIGLAYCILMVCSVVPFLGFLTGLAGFICWIIYWVKISDFKSKLQYSQAQTIPPSPAV